MIGKIILWILLAFLAVLVLALLIPVKVRFSYDQGDLALAVRYGPVKIRLFPPKEEEKKEKPPKKKKEGEKEGKKEKKEKPPKEKKKGKINSDQILYPPSWAGRCAGRGGASISDLSKPMCWWQVWTRRIRRCCTGGWRPPCAEDCPC